MSDETEQNSESTSLQEQPSSEHPPSPPGSPQQSTLNVNQEDPVINDLTNNIITYCTKNKVDDPVEILRYFQKVMVEGRALRIQESGRMEEGETNFILVDISNILETAFEEVKSLKNLQKTFEVQFYGEVSVM